MIRLHIALANLRYRLHRRPLRLRYRRARYLLWAKTRQEPPVRRLIGHEEELHAAVLAKRAERAATADDTNPHTPVTTVHRPAIYVDADGATVVRDRWGTAVVGGGA